MIQKKYFLPLLLVFLFSCEKWTQFEMDFNSQAVIPSSVGISLPVNIETPEQETNSETTFAVNDTRKDLIEEIRLLDLEITIDVPNGSDFSFLESIEIYLAAEDLTEVLIASNSNITPDTEKLILTPEDKDLQEYIKKEDFSIRLVTITDELITQDHQLTIYSNFFVDAKILN